MIRLIMLQILAVLFVLYTSEAQDLPYPLKNPSPVTSPFGDRKNPLGSGTGFHSGIDLGVPTGTSVFAVGDGTIVSCYPPPSKRFKGDLVFGGMLVLKTKYHGINVYVLYGHLSGVYVHEGQAVSSGQIIVSTGKTGEATGPHLHFQIMLDPIEALDFYSNLLDTPGVRDYTGIPPVPKIPLK